MHFRRDRAYRARRLQGLFYVCAIASTGLAAAASTDAPTLLGPVCEGGHSLFADHASPGTRLDVLRGTEVIGSSSSESSFAKLAIDPAITLKNGDSVILRQSLGSAIIDSAPLRIGCSGTADVYTHHNDNLRTGANLNETMLTPANVQGQGMHVQFRMPVGGVPTLQPLYISQVDFPAKRTSGLFASAAGVIFAFDATNGKSIWQYRLADSQPQSRPIVRDLPTPVIDLATQRMFVLFSTKNQALDTADCPDSKHPDPANCHAYEDQLASLDVAYWLISIDIRNGAELARTRVTASLTRTSGEAVVFVPKNHLARPALLLDHGFIYLAFGSRTREEIIEYHGWVIAHRASDLSYAAAFCTTRDAKVPTNPFDMHTAEGAGIWQSGGGLAADPDGNVFLLTGNAAANIAKHSFGDAFVRLVPYGDSFVADAYIPEGADQLEAADGDLGSGSPMVIPGTNTVVGGGKTGYLYSLDRSSMAARQRVVAATNQYNPALRDQSWNAGPHLHGPPTYWRGADPQYGNLYVWGEKDHLRLYRYDVDKSTFEETAAHVASVRALADSIPGGMLSLSANGNQAGTGILWATLPYSSRPGPGAVGYHAKIYAFDAENLRLLWEEPYPAQSRWVPPTVAGGMVYVASASGEIIAYALGAGRPSHPPANSRRTPNPKFYDEESEIASRPAMALNVLAPPPSFTQTAVLEGRGTATRQGWRLSFAGGTAKFDRATSNLYLKQSDGSTLQARLIRTVRAPEPIDAPWSLFEVRKDPSSPRYIQLVFTSGGKHPGRFEAQLILFHSLPPPLPRQMSGAGPSSLTSWLSPR